MEKTSTNKRSQSTLADLFEFAIFHAILNWVLGWKELPCRYFSFFHSQLRSLSERKISNFDKVGKLLNGSSLPCCATQKGDDDLSREDAEMMLEKLGISKGGEQLTSWLDSSDLSVIFEEEEPSLEEVKSAFNVFDQNKDGFIDAEELQRVLCILGFKEGLNLDSCKQMIRVFDVNGDERIDFKDFVKLMENCFC